VEQESNISKKSVDMVLTAIARDRPGVVENLADVIAAHSGNWVESSMAQLGGEFAGIVRVEVPADATAKLEEALSALDKDGIDITVHKASSYEPPSGHHARLELTGMDHTGIVLEVTRTLSRHGVSIDELNTSVSRGSMGAEPIFLADADIVLPTGLDLNDLRDILEQIGTDIMVDIELTDA